MKKNDHRSETKEEIISLIKEAHGSIKKDMAIYYLEKAKALCGKIIKEGITTGYAMMAEINSEFAKENNIPSERNNYWQNCLSNCLSGLEKNNTPTYAILLANKTVDYIQDQYVFILKADANKLISNAKEKIDYFINKLSKEESSHLLSRKSALLRNKINYCDTRVQQERISQEALRCAQKSVDYNQDSWDAYLELALSQWNIAQFEKNEEKYHILLSSAEECYWKSITIEPTVYGFLGLCRFYRNTYQTTPFIECFDIYSSKEYNKRRFLQSSYVYGEAVMQLWYSEFPESITNSRLEDAERILEESINGGFYEARHLVDLAFIKAAKNDTEVAIEILSNLHSLSKGTSWNEISRIVSDTKEGDDLIKSGFALGIDDSSVWNKLGTFIGRFVEDLPLSIFLYKESLRLNPSNAVAMTNLARALLRTDTLESIREANMWISKAASCADRRFRWWRNVREEIHQKLSSITDVEGNKQKQDKQIKLGKLTDLYKYYQNLKTAENHQTRGYELERLVKRLFNISLKNSFPSYRTSSKIFNTPSMQIDSAFSFFDRDFYRVETKWTSSPIKPKDIVLFREKLDVVDVKGLFISITGFSEKAIQKAFEARKEFQILLMDGEELDVILKGSPSLDEAIRLKQLYFLKESNPYYKINTTVQTDVS